MFAWPDFFSLKTATRLRFDITNHQHLWRSQHGSGSKLRWKVIETWLNSWSFRRSKVALWLVAWWKCSHVSLQTLPVPLRSDYQTVWKQKELYANHFFFNICKRFAHLVLWLKGNIWLHALHKLSASQDLHKNFLHCDLQEKKRLRILRTWVHLCLEKTKLMFWETKQETFIGGIR